MNTENIQTWNDMIRGFLQSKQDAEEEKYLKNTLIKSVAKSYEEKRYFGEQHLKDFFDLKKNKKEESQTSLEFQRDKYFKMRQFTKKPENIDWSEIQYNYQKKCDTLQKKYEATLWLEDAATNAASVSFATHVVKLTHSKIDSPSFLEPVDN